MIWINLVESAIWSHYNTVVLLKLLEFFHRKMIYVCKIYNSPPGIVGMTISMKQIWEYLSKPIQISNAISLNSDEPQAHTHHLHVIIISSLGSRCVPWLGEGLSMSSPNDLHVLPAKVKCCISASVHFHKS